MQNLIYFRDASDAVHERDGYNYDGYTLRVEFPRGGGPGGPRSGGGGGYGFRGGSRGLAGGRGGPPSRRSEYRVLVSGNLFISILSNKHTVRLPSMKD